MWLKSGELGEGPRKIQFQPSGLLKVAWLECEGVGEGDEVRN